MVDDREVAVTNPDKVLFPGPGHTKRDLVRYYLAVADGALRAAGGRPNMLVRYPNGVGVAPFYQKRAPAARPDWIETATLRFPSGRRPPRSCRVTPPPLAWMANLACLELHPHPVRAEDLDHPDELRVDLDPTPGVEWPQVREVAAVVRRRSATSAWSAGRRRRARAACTSTCGSSRAGLSTRCGAPRWRSPAMSNGGCRRWPPASGGRKNGTASSSTTTRTPRTAPSPRPIRCAPVPMPGCRRRWPGTRSPTANPAASPWRRCRRASPRSAIRTPRWTSTRVHSSALLALADRQAADGQGDAPWPPHYRRQPGEPPRAAPSRRRKPPARE